MKRILLFSFCMVLAGPIFSQKIYQAKIVIDAKATLGEGSIWIPSEKKLYWIDIDEKTLFTFDPVKNENLSYSLGQKVGTAVPIDTGGVLVALKDGIYSFNFVTKNLSLVVSPEKNLPDNRFNDGKCDPAGRFWAGTLGPNKKAALYRIAYPDNCKKMIDSVSTSNGIVWSSDKKKMYYIDTPTGKVVCYQYNLLTGEISDPTTVIKFPAGVGYPDGMTIDAQDKLWIAHWGGSCVGCWDPETGKMIAKVEVPAINITSCAFGGENLDTLYITTARTGMNDAQLKAFPQSGGLFFVKTDSKGVPANYFKTKP